jgi:hypothetical protein
LVFDDSQTFPKNRALLYGEALDVLLKKWAAEKRVQRNPIYQDLTYALEEMMLAGLAYQGFQSNQLFFSQQDVVEQIREFLADNLNAPKHLDADVILEAIQVQQGILVERATDVLSFSHLTIQEYLTAKHIIDHNFLTPLIDHHITDSQWREVILLVAGLSRGGADELLKQMSSAARQKLNSSKLQSLIRWSAQIIDHSTKTYKPAAKRAIALFCALNLKLDRAFAFALDLDSDLNFESDNNTLTRAHALARALDIDRAIDTDIVLALDLARTLDLALDKKQLLQIDFSALIVELQQLNSQSQISVGNPPNNDKQGLALRFHQIWYGSWGLDARWVDLSREEIQTLNEYFYINELMLRCKESAVRISPQVWQEIESQMLTLSP